VCKIDTLPTLRCPIRANLNLRNVEATISRPQLWLSIGTRGYSYTLIGSPCLARTALGGEGVRPSRTAVVGMKIVVTGLALVSSVSDVGLTLWA